MANPNMPQPFPAPTPPNQNPAQVGSIPANAQLQPDLTGQSYVGGMLPTIRVMPASANANAAINSISQTVTQNVTNVIIPTIPPPSFGDITTGQNLKATMVVGTGAFLGYANYFVNGNLVGTTAFVQGEAVVQSVSGATSVVAAFYNGQIQLGPIVGAPNSTGAWTGQTSGAIYAVNALPTVSSGIINASEIGTITVKGSVPSHAGQLLISQPGNSSAVWADPQVQGLYAAGSSIASPPVYSAPTTICPVGVGGSKAGVLQYLLLDSSGFLEVSIGGAATVAVQGTLTNNNAAPSNNNLGVLGLVANAADPSWTEGDMVVGSTTLAGYQRVILHAETTKVIGTVNQGTSPWVTNVSQFGGSNVVTGTGVSGSGIPRFTVSNDSQIRVWDGTTQAGVIVATTALKTDMSSIAGNATVSVVAGVQKVAIADSAGNAITSNKSTQNQSLDTNLVSVLGGTMSKTNGAFFVGTNNTDSWTIKPASTASVDGDTSLVTQLSPKQPQLDTALNVQISGLTKVIVWDGTNQNTYKPASTAAVAGDTSLVTQISPNQPTALSGATTPAASPGHTVIVGGIYNSSSPSPSNGQVLPLQQSSNGSLIVSVNGNVSVTGSAIAGSTTTETLASWTSATSANTVLTGATSGYGTLVVSIKQGSTISGGVLTFEVSDTSPGTDWYPITGSSIDGSVTAGTTYTLVQSTNIGFQFAVAAWQTFRVRLSTAITGSATVAIGVQAMAFGGGSSSGGGGGNTAASATGAAVPASASYSGINVGGTLRGATGVNPSGTVYAAQTDLTSVGGTTFALGQQLAASSLPVVLTAAQLTTLTPPATAIVSDVSAIDMLTQIRDDFDQLNDNLLGGSCGIQMQAGNTTLSPVVVPAVGNALMVQPGAQNGIPGNFGVGNYGTSNTSAATWTTATAQNTTAVLVNNVAGYSSISVTLNQAPTGSLSVGAVTFETSNDGINWYGIAGADPNALVSVGPTYTLIAATYSLFVFTVPAPYFRVRLSTAITGTGTVTIGYAADSLPTIHNFAGTISGSLGSVYNSTPPAPSATATVNLQSDYEGNLFVKHCRRSQIVPQATTIASSSAATTILAAQAAGIYADLTNLIITPTSQTTGVAFTVTLSDGTASYVYDMNTGSTTVLQIAQPLNLNWNPALSATSTATAWTVALSSASVTVHITAVAVLQKAS